MLISNSYKKNAEALAKEISAKYKDKVIISSPEKVSDDILKKIGFSTPILNGANIVPDECGRFTRFNLYGKEVVRKDLPKINRYVNTIYWEWKLWNGDWQGKYCDIYKDCYPRESLVPPLESVYFNANKNSVFSREIPVSNQKELLHIVNIFLEIFGSCYVTDDKNCIIPLKQVPWVIFPIGEKPYTLENLFSNCKKLNKREKEFLKDRIDFLESSKPDAIYKGESYFRNYLAFVYQSKNLAILESDYIDNATYIFDLDWKTCSQLTKGEVLSKKLHKDRIIHQKNWFSKMQGLLKQ